MTKGIRDKSRDDECILHEWPKNDHEVIRATVKTWKGKQYYSLRLYYRSGNDSEFHPTKKGLTLGGDHLPDLLKAVQALAEAAKGE